MPPWVLDANEYVFSFGPAPEPDCVALLDALVGRGGPRIAVCRTIVQEVVGNLDPRSAKAFFSWMALVTEVDEDETVPFEVGYRYETMGFKPADAFIAAYAEHVGAGILVSENRHFLRARGDLPFKVLDAEAALRAIKG